MSRSKGAGGLADLIKRQGGERIRFFLLRTHYRSTVLFNEPAIEEAGVGLESFYRLFKRYTRITGKDFYTLKPPAKRANGESASAGGQDPVLTAARTCHQKFLTAMDDDFNTGGAIGELFELAKITNKFCDDADLEGKGKSDTAAVAKFTSMLTTLRELTNILGYDGSGFPSVVIGNFSNQMLGMYHNEGKGLFVDEAPSSAVGRASLLTLAFGIFFLDYDNDGLLDLFIANGHLDADIHKVQQRVFYATPPHLFRNLGVQALEDVVA